MRTQRNKINIHGAQQAMTTIKNQLSHRGKPNLYQISNDDEELQENQRLRFQQEGASKNAYANMEDEDGQNQRIKHKNGKGKDRLSNHERAAGNVSNMNSKIYTQNKQRPQREANHQIQNINIIIESQISKRNAEQQESTNLNKRLNIVIAILLLLIVGSLFVHRYLSIAEYQLDHLAANIDEASNQNAVPQNLSHQQMAKQKQIQLKNSIQAANNHYIASAEIKNSPNGQISSPPSPAKGITSRNSVNKQVYSKSLNLNDFVNQTVYQTAPPQMKEIFDEMIKRPQNHVTRPNMIFMPTQKAYFAYSLYKSPQNAKYQQAEQYYYEHKYNLNQYKDQLALCIVAPGRNLIKSRSFMKFIDSVQGQNYSNYRLVYIDDASDDDTIIELQKYIKQSKGKLARVPQIQQLYDSTFVVNEQYYKEQTQQRTIIVKNKQRAYALANRNKGIRNYCPESSIVLDVDADDSLIGRQVFRVINAIYHNEDVWMFNSVFIYDKSQYKQVTTGPQEGVPIEVLQKGNYRTCMMWKTSELRTFKAQLFNKINENDFKQQNGEFFQWASDVFTQQPLVELAGPKHYKHLYEIMYFYDWNFDKTTVYKRRHYRDIAFMQTPYKPLPNLQAAAQKVENHEIHNQILREYEKNIVQARKQAIRYRRQLPF